MSGTQLRLGRLFDSTSGRSFIAAIDHGVTLGVPSGAEDIHGAVQRVIDCQPDCVLISPGMLTKHQSKFAFRGAPATMVRLDWFVVTDHHLLSGYDEHYRVLCGPAHAAAIGADAVILFLLLGPERGAQFADNIRAISQAAEEAHRVGIPLIVEAVAWGSRLADHRKDPEHLAFGCRMAAEVGADAVKTEWTGDQATMADVVSSAGVPVLVLGGPKSNDLDALVTATEHAMRVGAKGVIYGRNVWQQPDPVGISRRLREVIHGSPSLVGG